MPEELDIAEVDLIVSVQGRSKEAVIQILEAIQERYRYLPQAALERVCEISDISPASIEGVSTFYSRFRRNPVGEHIVSVCDGTACHVKGSIDVYDALVKELQLAKGEDTDSDSLFTVQRIACLGCCTLAPVVQIDSTTYGHVRPATVSRMLRDFLDQEAEGRLKQSERITSGNGPQGEIRIGLGSCCVAGGARKVQQALEQALTEIRSDVPVKHVSCVCMCHQTPLVEVLLPNQPGKLYAKVEPEDVREIVGRHFKPQGALRRIRTTAFRWFETLYTDEGRDVLERYSINVRDKPVSAFLDGQLHLATEHSGKIDPTDLQEYVRLGGFDAVAKCLSRSLSDWAPLGICTGQGSASVALITLEVPKNDLSPEAIIEEITRSGLRGRGGAGFPTGQKWSVVRKAPGEKKYIICNGDEGDPGAFMDRMILESYSYRVIEGMIIASFAVGASEGIFYIRAEYPLAVQRIRRAIKDCEEARLLGDNILGSGHSLHLKVIQGAGAFVCGEETALIASLEGERGIPSFRPPYPAEQGLNKCPTLVNNTETYALVPWIIRNGGEAFAEIGTETSKGTKVFSLAGKIKRGGLIEVPMGISIRRIVDEIGGGVADGRTFKAVQVGGPSGGCVPASLGDTPADYEALSAIGAMMGSGGFVVLDDSDCMVEMARYFLSFTQLESCGKCTPCRVGTKRMLELLTRLCEGDGKSGDLERLDELARLIKTQSLCGLGKTAPNPVLTTLRYFREEFEAHVRGHCPAGKCKALITYSINDECTGCTKCAQVCADDAIELRPYQQHEIDLEKCTKCDSCRQVCPVDAVKVE